MRRWITIVVLALAVAACATSQELMGKDDPMSVGLDLLGIFIPPIPHP